MTGLRGIRARHVQSAGSLICEDCLRWWPCDTGVVLAALDRAEAVVAAARRWDAAKAGLDRLPAGKAKSVQQSLDALGFLNETAAALDDMRDALAAYDGAGE